MIAGDSFLCVVMTTLFKLFLKMRGFRGLAPVFSRMAKTKTKIKELYDFVEKGVRGLAPAHGKT